MAPPLLQLSGIALTFGGKNLLEDAALSVSAGERVCLVGRNGSGKSTLLKIAAGTIEQDRGARFIQPGATIRYLAQEPDFSGHASVLSYVMSGLGPSDEAYQAQYLIEQLGMRGDEDPSHLSGGESRRAAIAHVLAPNPDILLLDEPTNHLDLPTIEWLEAELASRQCALVLISHDRRFLATLSRATIWLDRGRTRRIEHGFSAFEAWRDTVLAEEEEAQHKLGRKIEDEEHWLRYGVTARRKRNVRRLENLHQLRTDRREHRGALGKANIAAAEAGKTGALIIEADKICKSFGARAIVRDFSTRIMRADRIGIVGPNGAGKTTLVSLLTGITPPDSGTVKLGTNLQMATLEQSRQSLDPNASLADTLTGGGTDTVMVGNEARHVIGYMKDFLFAPEQARTPLRVLSGGERGRLMLARSLALPSNVLILDEPTNDLDLETLDVLEEMLSQYAGTIILISHDRDFIDRVVNAVIVPQGDGRWLEYAGGYSDMLAQSGAAPAPRQSAKGKSSASATRSDAPAAAPKAAKRKLGFHEKHALETLPGTIAKLQAAIEKLQTKLDDPGLFARDRQAFGEISDLMTRAQGELASAEEQWLELEIRREDIEGNG